MSNLKGKKLSIFKQFQALQIDSRQKQANTNSPGKPTNRLRNTEFVKMKITIPRADKIPSLQIQSFTSLPSLSPKSDNSYMSARSFHEETKVKHKPQNFLRRDKFSGPITTRVSRDSKSFHSFDDRQIRQNTKPQPKTNEYQLSSSQNQSKLSSANIQPGLRARTLESEISTESTPILRFESEGVLPLEKSLLPPETKLLKSGVVRLPKQKYTLKEMDFQIPEIDENEEENGDNHQVYIGAGKSSIKLLGGMSLKQSQRVFNPKQLISDQSDQSLKSSQKAVTFSSSDIGMRESGRTNNLTTSESLSINSNFTSRNIKLNKMRQQESFKSIVQSDFTENDEEFNIWDNQNDVRVAVAVSEMDSDKNRNIEEFLKLYKIRYGVFPGQEQQISNEQVIQAAVKYMGTDKKLFKKYFPNREVKFDDENDYSKPYEVKEDINYQHFKSFFDNSQKKVAPLVTFTIPKVAGRVFKESTFRRYRSEKSNITHASPRGDTSDGDGGLSSVQD